MTFCPEKIRKRRLQLGLTQQDLAKASGISREHLAVLEAGKANPRIDTISKIANALGVSARYFFARNESKN
jgi:transcriptional regulator with XRE-family HTH domain